MDNKSPWMPIGIVSNNCITTDRASDQLENDIRNAIRLGRDPKELIDIISKIVAEEVMDT